MPMDGDRSRVWECPLLAVMYSFVVIVCILLEKIKPKKKIDIYISAGPPQIRPCSKKLLIVHFIK